MGWFVPPLIFFDKDMTMFEIYKRLMDVFVQGELIRIKETGETFIYQSSTGGANFSSYLCVSVGGTWVHWRKALHVDEVVKVNASGAVLDDFSHLKQKNIRKARSN